MRETGAVVNKLLADNSINSLVKARIISLRVVR